MPQFAVDYLGGALYPAAILSTHPPGWWCGFFAKEFGDSMPITEKLLDSGRSPGTRQQLIWRANHVYGKAELKEAVALAKRWNQLAKRYPSLHVELSPFCEHRNNRQVTQEMYDRCRDAAPNCLIVNTPESKENGRAPTGAFLPNVVNECHGFNPTKPMGIWDISFDGLHMLDVDIEDWKEKNAGARRWYAWANRHNLRQQEDPENGKYNPPPKERKAKPKPVYLRQANSLLFDLLEPMEASYPVEPFPDGNKKWIYKVDAEDKVGNKDSRANRPMVISPHKGDCTIRALNGKQLGIFKFYGTYAEPGTYRAYSGNGGIGLYGIEIAEMAFSASGCQWVTLSWASDKKKKSYLVHPTRRAGIYRNTNG